MSPGTGSKPTADARRSPLRARWVATAIGTAVLVAFLLVVILPRASEVGDALNRVGPGRFVAIVALAAAALVFRTIGWQVAVDAAGGEVHPREAHASSAVCYTIGLLNQYVGGAVRIGILRRTIPDRSPTAAQQVAAETVSFVIEAALVSLLILAASWTLGIPLWAALLIVIAGVLGVAAMVVVAQRWTAPRFSAGLAVAREPRSLASLTAALAATLLSQIGRVGLALSSVGLHSSLIVVIAVFVASGASAVIPIGTAAAGATAPLIAAAGKGSEGVANASAAGVLLAGSLLVADLLYLAVTALLVSALRRRHAM
jgi:uncharacterized membrane protein YbhN (UPF0104 family)